ncbi:MAG: fumarylacetoacetate hydrolase family protein [Rhizobiales bacterium]|nr:fumarylacetoacetate hydrolase family protein [Hyphomicrobiales bacterium]
MEYVFTPAVQPWVAVHGEKAGFPVRRIFCVGRNYAAHAREMGKDPEREAPFFFTKPADAVVQNGAMITYPKLTEDFHYEIELVVAIGKDGSDIEESDALNFVYGYAVGVDLTRRDLQLDARDKGRPWDWGKAFDNSAPCTAIHQVGDCGHIDSGRIWLAVNGETKQQADVADLIWSVPEIISICSKAQMLRAGDLIFTGTPAGVGPIVSGDRILGGVDGLTEINIQIG